MRSETMERGIAAALALLSAVGCGRSIAESGSGDPGAEGRGVAGSFEIEAAPCQKRDAWTVYTGPDDAVAQSLSLGDRTNGLLWWSDTIGGPRELRFSEIDAANPVIKESVTLTSSSLITTARVVRHDGVFVAAWVDAQLAVHVGRLSGQTLASDTVVAQNTDLTEIGLGHTASGRLVVGWSSFQGTLTVATSPDGVVFSTPSTIGGAGFGRAISIAEANAGAAIAWSAFFQNPDQSNLHFALVRDDGAAVVPDTALTHHDRYVYDVALMRGKDSFAIATTDSRVDIGNVPLYATSVSLDGKPSGVDHRLTFSGGHEFLDGAFSGAAFGVVYDEHDGIGTQVHIRQLAPDGADLFGAFQVSSATYKRYDCCTDTRYAQVASRRDGSFLVVWSEVEARAGGGAAFSLKAAALDCAEAR